MILNALNLYFNYLMSLFIVSIMDHSI